jgi:hypothetical protein
MNGPFVVAQANTGGSSATPVQVLKLIKPPAGHTDILHASFTGTVKIDFTAIANDKITLFHDSKNQSLHVIFADGSQIIIEPFFDSRGTVLANLIFEMTPNEFYSGEEFAQKFTVSEDPSVVPAAGDAVLSGGDFHDPSVDPLPPNEKLALLPPEELPNINFTITEAPVLPPLETAPNQIPTLGQFTPVLVEEEELNQEFELSDAGQGNEDTHDKAGDPLVDGSGNDQDIPSDFTKTQYFVTGTIAGLVIGGDLPITFLTNSTAEGAIVRDKNGDIVTSLSETVTFHVVDASTVEGWTSFGEQGARLIFTLHFDSTDGAFTFTLNDQIDHHQISHDTDTTNPDHLIGIFEETLFLDLSPAITAHDASSPPDVVIFPPNSFDIGVIDDTPVTFETCPIYPQPYNDFVEGSGTGTFSKALDDEQQSGGIQGGPGDDGFGKHLYGFLDIRYGADGPSQFECGNGTNPLVFDPTKILVTNDAGDTIPLSEFKAIYVDGNGIGTQHQINISWTDGWFGGGTLTGTADDGNGGTFDVFRLHVNPDGSYTFTLCAPLAHPFNADGESVDPVSAFEDNLHIQFTYTATDYDLDTVDGHVTINVDDDTPTIASNDECVDFTLDYSAVKAGHVDERGMDGAGDRDVLLSGAVGAVAGAVNTTGNDIGVANQWLDGKDNNSDEESLRLDFVNSLTFSGNGPTADFNYTGHYLVDSASFTIEQIKGGSGNTATVFVQIFDANDSKIPGSPENYNDDGNPIALALSDVTVTGDATYTKTLIYDGGNVIGVAISGLNEGDLVTVNPPGDHNFDRLVITNYSGVTASTVASGSGSITFDGDSFSVGGVQSQVCQAPTIDVSIDETNGVNTAADPNPADDVDPASAPTALADAITAAGVTMIDLAESQGTTAQDLFIVNFGADGENPVNGLSLQLTTAGGAGFTGEDTGLTTTVGGFAIHLFTDPSDPNIVWGVANGDLTSGERVFALYLDGTGHLWVAQFEAIAHDSDGSTPAAYDDIASLAQGLLHVSAIATDGDSDSVAATSSASLSVNFQDDGIGVNVSLAPAEEGSGSAQLAGLVLDESIGADPADSNAANDDNPPVTDPSYITAANSSLAIGITSTPGNADPGTSVSDLFQVTKFIGTDGLADEQKIYSLTLTNDSGDPVLAGSGDGVLTNLHVTETGGSPVDGFSADNRAVWLFKVSDTEIVGLIGQDTPGDSTDDFVALHILLDTTNPSDPILKVEQYLPLEHPDNPNNFDESIFLNFADIESGGASLAVTLTDTVTDGDGDTATDSESVTLASAAESNTQSGTSLIEIQDDGPSSATASASEVGVVHDETEGVQTAGDPNASNDVGSGDLPAPIKDLFDAIGADRGSDPDVTQDDHAIGFAASLGSLASASGGEFGTDGPHTGLSEVFSLSVIDGTFSGLKTTEGFNIYLYNGSGPTEGLILGRVGNDNDDTPNDPNDHGVVAFALTVDANTGIGYIAQYLSLQHPDQANSGNSFDSYDEQISIDPDAVQLVGTIVDGDGDALGSQGVSVGQLFAFQDDGPTVSVSGSYSGLGTIALDETIGTDIYGSGDTLPHDNNGASDDTAFSVADPTGTNPFGSQKTADGALAVLFSVTKDAGSDGEKSDDRTLSLQLIKVGGVAAAVGDGVQSTLAATQPAPGGNPDSDGNAGNGITPYADPNIYLFLEADGTITGRVGNDANGAIAFRISLTSDDPTTAALKIDQFLAIDHPLTPDVYDDQLTLGIFGDTSEGTAAGIGVNLSVTLTDGDNDSAVASATHIITNSFTFDDDGPDVQPANRENNATLELDESIVLPTTTPQEGGTVDAGADDTALTQVDGIHPIGVATGDISTFFNVHTGTDGGSSEYSLIMKVLSDEVPTLVSVLQTGFFATQPALGGNPDSDTGDSNPFTPYADAQIYLFQTDAQHIEGHVGNSVTGPLALKIFIDASTGEVTFEQYLALDHGQDGNNFDSALLGTSTLSEGVVGVLTVTDGDGDKSAAEVPLSVRIEDDGPAPVTVGDGSGTIASIALNLDETINPDGDGLKNGGDTYAAAESHDDNGDLDDTGQAAVDGTNAIGSLTTGAGAVAGLFSVGTLDAGTDGQHSVDYDFAFNLSLNGAQTSLKVTQSAPGGNPDSDGIAGNGLTPYADATIYLFQTDDHTIEGHVGNNVAGPLALKIILNDTDQSVLGDETITFEQYLAIDHGNDGNAFDTQSLLKLIGGATLDLGLTVTLTDGDTDYVTGDHSVTLIDGVNSPFSIDDDGPTAPTLYKTGTFVVHDETGGLQNGGVDDLDGNDVAGNTLPSSILAAFNGLTPTTDDPDVSEDAFSTNHAIGFARSGSSLVVSLGGSTGTDGGTASYDLNIPLAGTWSGIRTTDGHDIFLYKEGDLIVGRVGTEASATPGSDTADPNGTVAFAIALDKFTGEVFVAQWLSLEQLTPGDGTTPVGSYDEPISLIASAVTITETITDGDGDHVSSNTVGIGDQIRFEDDGLSVSATSASVVHDETPGNQGDANDTSDALPAAFATRLAALSVGTEIGHARGGAGEVTITAGADGLKNVALTGSTGAALNGVDSGLDKTGGFSIFLYTDPTNDNIVLGREGTNDTTANPNGTIVFAIYLDQTTGELWLTQYGAIEHPTPGNSYDEPISIDPNLIYVTATDGDNDTATSAAAITVTFQDDGPTAPTVSASSTVAHDETPGVQNTADPNAQNDVLGTAIAFGATTVASLFAGVPSPGDDPDVAGTGPIGYAASTGSLVTLIGGGFGTDGAAGTGSVAYSLIVTDGTFSGVKTTDGHNIYLYAGAGGLILGRVGNDSDALADDPNAGGTVAFALATDPASGKVFVAQYLSLLNPTAGNTAAAYDEPVFLSTAPGSVQMQVTYTDGDGDTASNSGFIGNAISFQDDGPRNILPDTAVLLNVAGKTATTALDFDTNVNDNYGADGGDVQFATSLQGANSGKTSGGLPILYSISGDGHVLTGFVDTNGIGGYQDGVDTKIFTIALNLDGSLGTANDTYTVTMFGTVDGQRRLDFSSSQFQFEGGNDPWSGFLENDGLGHNDLLLTPMIGGVSDGTTNTNANEGGVDGGNSVGSGEAMRLDFISNLAGNPNKSGGSGDYSDVVNQDHTFTGHYNTNGASATFTNISGGSATSDVRIKAFDDPDGNNTVGDGTRDDINGVGISFGGETLLVTVDGTYTVGGHDFTVDFQNVSGHIEVVVGSVVSNTQIATFTSSGYNSLEYHWEAGQDFKIGGFGASATVIGAPAELQIPLTVIDGDQDTASGQLFVDLLPASPSTLDFSASAVGVTQTVTATAKNILGSSHQDSLTGDGTINFLAGGGDNDTLTGLGGNDTLLGGDGSDTLIGGAGADTLVGGLGADHFRYTATTDGTDHIRDFSTIAGDSIDILVSAFTGAGLVVGTDATGIFGSDATDTFGSTTERFHFNTATHTLLYDSNGSAAGGTQVTLAVLENGGAVDAQHIHMV